MLLADAMLSAAEVLAAAAALLAVEVSPVAEVLPADVALFAAEMLPLAEALLEAALPAAGEQHVAAVQVAGEGRGAREN
jgi:hypothetical protein